MDKYNVKALADFFVRHEFYDFAVIFNYVLAEKRKDKKWHLYWGEPSIIDEYNKRRTETTIWRKIMVFDPEYGRMSARQKVELVDLIIEKLEVPQHGTLD